MILNCRDPSNWVQSLIKTRQDNYVIDCTSLVYAKIETELSGPIKLCVVYFENHTGQRCDWSYKFGIYTEIETKLPGPIWLSAFYDETR